MPAIEVIESTSLCCVGGSALVGNVSVVSHQEIESGAIVSLRDALSSSAGVYVENPAGQENAKVSIRGSGISNRLGTRGIRFLVDGVPISRSDDTVDVAYADANNFKSMEIYRGSNAAVLGVSTLGGAINSVSPTGRDSAGVTLRSEVGSNDYVRLNAQAGQAWDGGADAYVAISGMRTNGGRENSAQDVQRMHANVGYRTTSNIEHRLFLNLQKQTQQMPGPVTLKQAQSDPDAANVGFEKFGAQLHLRPVRTGVSYRIQSDVPDAGRWTLSTYYNRARFDTTGTYANLVYDSLDYGAYFRHELDYMGPAGASQLVWGVNYSTGSSDNATYGPVVVGPVQVDDRLVQFEDIWGRRKTVEAYISTSMRVWPSVSVVAGAVAMHANRSGEINVLSQSRNVPIFEPSGGRASYSALSPRLGLLADLDHQTQLYGNISKSAEPPTNFEFNSASSGQTLLLQRAWTAELGTRGVLGPVNWDTALYRSWVRDELLSVETAPNSGRYISGNAPNTVHDGVELALSGSHPMPSIEGTLKWQLAYTYNRFAFDGDPSFGNNRLPGIPRHVARAAMNYHHVQGLFIGPYVDFSSSWYADQQNTLRAPGHHVWNLRFGYEHPDRRSLLFVDVKNLANKAYVSTTDYLVNARGRDAEVFYPGAGRALIVGFQIQL